MRIYICQTKIILFIDIFEKKFRIHEHFNFLQKTQKTY